MKNDHYNQLLAEYAKDDRCQLIDDWQTVLNSPEGRRILLYLQEECGIYKEFPLEHLEYHTAKRNLGLNILSVANTASRENVLLAQAERNALISARNATLQKMIKE